MAGDEPLTRHNQKPDPPRQSQPGELLFEFHVERTHRFYRVELRDHGDFGVEASGCFDLVSRPSALNRGYKR